MEITRQTPPLRPCLNSCTPLVSMVYQLYMCIHDTCVCIYIIIYIYSIIYTMSIYVLSSVPHQITQQLRQQGGGGTQLSQLHHHHLTAWNILTTVTTSLIYLVKSHISHSQYGVQPGEPSPSLKNHSPEDKLKTTTAAVVLHVGHTVPSNHPAWDMYKPSWHSAGFGLPPAAAATTKPGTWYSGTSRCRWWWWV